MALENVDVLFSNVKCFLFFCVVNCSEFYSLHANKEKNILLAEEMIVVAVAALIIVVRL